MTPVDESLAVLYKPQKLFSLEQWSYIMDKLFDIKTMWIWHAVLFKNDHSMLT